MHIAGPQAADGWRSLDRSVKRGRQHLIDFKQKQGEERMKRSAKLISGVVLIFALLLGAGACAGPEKSASESASEGASSEALPEDNLLC